MQSSCLGLCKVSQKMGCNLQHNVINNSALCESMFFIYYQYIVILHRLQNYCHDVTLSAECILLMTTTNIL